MVGNVYLIKFTTDEYFRPNVNISVSENLLKITTKNYNI